MNRPTAPNSAAPSRLVRRIVLGTAFLLGVAVALGPRTAAVHAQEPATAPATAAKPPAKSATVTDGRGAEAKNDVGAETRAGAPADASPGASAEAATPPESAGKDSTGKPRKRARVTIDRLDTDREFDSFGEFAHNDPALAAMVVAIVAVVFFAPVLAIALVLWYRMRKNRLLNETMLKLAEKGIVPSADALDALVGGKQAAALAPYHEQAKQVRHRAAWSDLRKGVFVGGFGLALCVYSLLEDREPNALGLVLLFVGIGFVVLWWFEQRHVVPTYRAAPDAVPGQASGNAPGNPPPA